MLPKDPDLIKEIGYILIGFVGALISVIYGLLSDKKVSIISSIGMILIGGFIGWITGNLTDNNLVAGLGGALSLETMHIIKKEGPEMIKEKIKIFFKIK